MKSSKPSSPVYPVRAIESVHPRDGALGGRVVAQAGQVDVGQRGEDLDRARALDGEQAGRQRSVVEDGLEALQPLGQRVRHDGRIARVGDDQEARLAQAVDDEVVDDPAVGRADHRVLGAPDGQARRIGHERGGQRLSGVRSHDVQLAHVRQVEQPDPLADGPVLLDDRAVLDGHQPATELDQPGAELAVGVGQGRDVDRRLERVGHRPASAEAEPSGGTSDEAAPGPVPDPASSAAVRATRARSVSKVSIVAAASNRIQRTSSNSWS